ncbi:MAG: hypothetical protein ACLFVW_00855 [Phycisphaerae bacterium]
MSKLWQWLLGSRHTVAGGEGEWRFGFVAGYDGAVVLALLCVAAVMVYLTIRSYRREGDAPRRAKAILAAMRVVTVLLVLSILLRPALVLRTTRTLHSAVVVLLDDSLSMSLSDTYADDANAGRDEKLADAVGVDVDELGNLSRAELVRQVFTRPGGPLEQLREDHPLVLMLYSTDRPGREAYTRTLGEMPVGSAASQEDASGVAALLAPLSGAGFETDVATALRDAVEHVRGRRVAALVHVGDGQITTDSGRDRLTGAVAYAEQAGMQVVSVAVGDPTEPKNVAVSSLRSPEEVRQGSTIEFEADVSHRNLTGAEVVCRLLRREPEGGDFVDTGESVAFTLAEPDGEAETRRGTQTVKIRTEADELGEFEYRAVVDPLPSERNTDDNSADATVTVSEKRIHVLLVSGDAGWDFQYLRNFLLRQPELYKISVWQQNADTEVNQAASTGMKLSHLPRTLAELIGVPGDDEKPGYDVVILHDPRPTEGGFDADFAEMLKTFVVEHGGGVCYVAGNKHTDSTLCGRTDFKPLADLLPVILTPNTLDISERISGRASQAWPVEPTDYGLDHPIMRLGDSSRHIAEVWESLPALYWTHQVLDVKPMARVLAVNSDSMRRTRRRDREPVVAAMPVGSGKALYVGFSESWRWRSPRDGLYHRRFWSNVVRYLATLRARQVVISTGADRFDAGSDITIRAEAYDESFQPLGDETFDVELIDLDSGESRTVTLEKTDQPGRYRGTIKAERTGEFELTALRDDPHAEQKVASRRFVVELPRAETRKPEADAETSRALASRPEGAIGLCEAGKLPSLIPAERMTAVREHPRELWDTRLMLLLIVALLSAEWALRKKHNMA